MPWINKLVSVLPLYVETGVKIVAACFGHQILSRALGGQVGKNPDGRFVLGVELLTMRTGNLASLGLLRPMQLAAQAEVAAMQAIAALGGNTDSLVAALQAVAVAAEGEEPLVSALHEVASLTTTPALAGAPLVPALQAVAALEDAPLVAPLQAVAIVVLQEVDAVMAALQDGTEGTRPLSRPVSPAGPPMVGVVEGEGQLGPPRPATPEQSESSQDGESGSLADAAGTTECGTMQVYQVESHGDCVLKMPPGAILLADSGSAAHEMWALPPNVLSFQCHPELAAELALEKIWPTVTENGRLSAEESAQAKQSLTSVRATNAPMFALLRHFVSHGLTSSTSVNLGVDQHSTELEVEVCAVAASLEEIRLHAAGEGGATSG
mmetsp:Transcript_7158/g.12340  ORF Transcript_7158/g.12340 Transcript_7158/m.12340 type:complete len:380 (+) Transcript_7158:20-1159(+)